MTDSTTPSFIWRPGKGPDLAALARMTEYFPRPEKAMGEAWFMSPERRMFPELFSDLDTITDDVLEQALTEISSGPNSFGHHQEWTEWYHYLLPRLIERRWNWAVYHPAELLVTGFMTQHPHSDGDWPYAKFRANALSTLGDYIMASRFWDESGIPKCLNKWPGPTDICGWYTADGLLSASLFFCIKYLPTNHVGEWFGSVLEIPNLYWKAQVITWLIGAHPILTGTIGQPAQFPKHGSFSVEWNWSHAISGDYTGIDDLSPNLIPFLPEENKFIVLRAATDWASEEFFEEYYTNPDLTAVAVETTGMPDLFANLYTG